MVNGRKSHFTSPNDGKGFAYPALPETETRICEASTTTGLMLSQRKSSLPQDLNFKHFSKQKAQQTSMSTFRPLQESREFPVSYHDNRYSLKDISVFGHGLGRRKYFDGRSQHISHFCLHSDGAPEEPRGNMSLYQAEYTAKHGAVNVPNGTKRFPRNHEQRSAQAALAQTGKSLVWFGQNDC